MGNLRNITRAERHLRIDICNWPIPRLTERQYVIPETYNVEMDKVDPQLADLRIDLSHDHRAVHRPVDEVGKTRTGHVGQIILYLIVAACRD